MINSKKIWKNGENWKLGAQQCVERLALMAGLERGEKIVDVGCGVGGSARFLAKNYGCEVFGVNLSKKQLKTARRIDIERGLERKIYYALSDAEALPYPLELLILFGLLICSIILKTKRKRCANLIEF